MSNQNRLNQQKIVAPGYIFYLCISRHSFPDFVKGYPLQEFVVKKRGQCFFVGAVLTPLIGLIADSSWAGAIAQGMAVPAISYMVICWYGFFGARIRVPVYVQEF